MLWQRALPVSIGGWYMSKYIRMNARSNCFLAGLHIVTIVSIMVVGGFNVVADGCKTPFISQFSVVAKIC